jgi:signal transduction histidine kinase
MQRVHTAHAGQDHVIEVDVEPGLRALGHADRLVRVLGHLVQNSIDASRAGSCVRVRAWREKASAMIEVRDEGQGMTEAFVREQLFKPFRTTKPTGMGIGAYESHQYISELGGRIDVQSAPGIGTQVRVQLPLVDSGQVQPALHQAAA